MPRRNHRRKNRNPHEEWKRLMEQRLRDLEGVVFAEGEKIDIVPGVVVVYGHAVNAEKDVIGFDDPVKWE